MILNRNKHKLNIMKYLLLFTSLFIIMSCAPTTKSIKTIEGFESEKYLGKWYEIARLDHSFERGLDNVTATYSVKPDGKIKVLNQGIRQDGSNSTAEGKAYVVSGDNNPGELRVSFFWIFYAKYKIIYLDMDYQTAIVTGSRKNYLWILSRKPKLDKTELNKLLEFCKKNGYETDKLIFPKQN